MTRDQILVQLQMEYAARREDDQRRHEQRELEACERCEGLRKLLDARHASLMTGVRQGIVSKRKDPGAAGGLSDMMAQYNDRIRAALVSGGFAPDFLQPVYQCAECRDEGYVYDPSRRMCGCMARELNARMLAELGLAGDTQTFESFDETLFDDTPDERGVSPRKAALVNRALCERYADSFPDTPTRDLLLIGQSGLGKTYLLRAIQHRVAKRGFQPLYVSAYRFFETARQSYIENDSALMSELMNAPLLLLDDLGTEPLMNNVTVAQLFNLLNERQIAGRHTVISTNLSINELKERYTERVTSRFLDATGCKRLSFIGTDVRMRKGVRKA